MGFFFPAVLEFRLDTNWSKSIVQKQVCTLTANQLSAKS